MTRAKPPRELRRFERSKQRIDDFIARHRPIMREYEFLVEEYNATLQAADHEIRVRRLRATGWDLLSLETRHDAALLERQLGRAAFLQAGGLIQEKASISAAAFKAAVKTGHIPPELAAAAKTVNPKYSSPKKATLP